MRRADYGKLPHAGMAPGVERMLMLLCGGLPYVSGSTRDLMCGAPGDVTGQQLREVHIKVRE